MGGEAGDACPPHGAAEGCPGLTLAAAPHLFQAGNERKPCLAERLAEPAWSVPEERWT